MKKEQRQVLNELEKQLSSLISEKEKLEERQVTSISNTKLTRRKTETISKGKEHSFVTHAVSFFLKLYNDLSQVKKGKKAVVCNSTRFFFYSNYILLTCRKIVMDSYNKFKIQH